MVERELLEKLEAVVRQAASELLEILAKPGEVDSRVKTDRSLVTSADLALNRLIHEALRDSFPVVSEEEPESHALLESSGRLWLVDPLDGTSTFRRFRQVRNSHVGFGPIVSLAEGRRLQASAFYHVPQRTLYTAVAGGGAWAIELEDPTRPPCALGQRRKLQARSIAALREAMVLFYPGSSGELRIVEELQAKNLVDELNNFGGFANHCVRLGNGSEQIQFQFSVGPWDYGAVLLLVEAGYSVLVDPLGAQQRFENWAIQRNNPVLAYPQLVEAELLKVINTVRAERQKK